MEKQKRKVKWNQAGMGIITGFAVGVIFNQLAYGLIGGVILEALLSQNRK